ncbi:serine hydrolase [Rhodovulum sp. DZ06]|uniref:serine hydrolase n=1 Tax=Rhodovulum sp. DZ06 TaxID=3425126 RepID=UPI003D339ACA
MTDALHACVLRPDGPARILGDPGARFPFWSVTKTATAAAVLALADAGALALDAPDPARGWTLRQLLAHTAGAPCYGGLRAYHDAVAARGPAWDRDAFLARIPPPPFAPGAGWAYSNIGCMLAREAVEAAGGAPLDALLPRLIPGAPAGLRLARSPADWDGLPWPEARAEASDYDPGWVAPGCLTGTARDAAELLAALAAGPAWARMTRERTLGGALPGRPWTRHGYGLGVMCGAWGDAAAAGHSGAGPFSACAVYRVAPPGAAPAIVAAFLPGGSEAPAEAAALRLARA